MSEPFHWDGYTHFNTVQDFGMWLHQQPKPAWGVHGLTFHHTYIPTIPQWRGVTTMQSLRRTYAARPDWYSGPHFFVCKGAPNPHDDGVWIGTPIAYEGIHAGKCNSDHFGMEIVGNYDNVGWSPATSDFVYGMIVTVLQWLGVKPMNDADTAHLAGHRECLNNKSCPGNKINCQVVRQKVMALMAGGTTTTPGTTPAVRDVQVIGVPATMTLTQWKLVLGRHPVGLTDVEMERMYTLLCWLEIDPAFMLALWQHEAKPVWGQSPLQLKSNTPINARAADGDWRHTTPGPDGKPFLKSSTQQLGMIYSAWHIKEQYGAEGLITVQEIVHKLAPTFDHNAPDAYAEDVMNFMQQMRNAK